MNERGDGTVPQRLFWERHASPRSVWLLVATYPVVVLAVYRRSRGLAAAVVVSVLLSLRVSPPATDDAWATRVVRGEQVWLDRGLGSEPWTLALLALGALVQFATFRAASRRRGRRTAVGTAASVGLMGLFFDRMARLYEGHASGDGGAGRD
ncbi:DUF6653 family protein [Haloarcula onubensis]|uniref:Uncharacterized protein n=1 Tax=Haloarcula onubensis TaxID=2950539 RepID=A0ABU2FR17_9EURY|nr:DUF6653 family protein [Halomicroarcula sp. S3CR25-11]MDS0283205.1 hypothetical protein [Halomicroarcula sp. S3CR25-11]